MIDFGLVGDFTNGNSGGTPWEDLNSRFFQHIRIDPSRWDQLYPYRLLVIDTHDGNKIVNGADPTDIKTAVTVGTGSTIVDFQLYGNQWVYQLPISPEQLKITDQYAISTSATLRGVIEEHNGVKFKSITASGTFGVWPFRSSVSKPPSSQNPIQSLFGGTLSAFDNLVGKVNSAVSVAAGGSAAAKPVTVRPDQTSAGEMSTGYYQALALSQFLEQYAEAKKNPDNAGWRLVFDIQKQNQSFIVTPVQFDWTQSAQKTMDINYVMQFKAWRRIDLNENAFVVDPNVQTITPGILQRVLNTIAAARAVMSSSLNLLRSVRSDIEAPLDALRQTSLLIKDLAGVLITAADLPFQIQSDYRSAIASFLQSISINNLTGLSSSAAAAVVAPLKALQQAAKSSEGLSIASISGGQLGSAAALSQSVNPAYNVFDAPEGSYSLMDQAPVHSLTLSVAQQQEVDSVIQQVRQITVDDLKKYRAIILDLSLQLSNSFGAGNAFYNKLYGRPAPTPRVQPMTLEEYDILKVLYDVIQCYDILTATTDIDDRNKQNNMAYVSGLASDSNIDFSTSTSKVLAPVPFGMTIEQIAAKYLQDPSRWLEIVTLNNLREPYIDENGFTLRLLSNATGRQITVNSAQNLFVGQRILIKSISFSPSPRVILGIDKLSSTSFLITLDGPANLDNYTLTDGAFIQAYLPGTVNSQQKIFIPSDLAVPNLPNITPPSSTSADPLTGLSKVDLLLTEYGDLAINNYGDFRLASGMTNLIQAIKIKMGTPKGSLLLYPEFGLGIRPGVSNADIRVADIYKSINTLIKQDSRFAGLASLQIILNGPKLTINMGVIIANQKGVYPLSFTLT